MKIIGWTEARQYDFLSSLNGRAGNARILLDLLLYAEFQAMTGEQGKLTQSG